MEHITVETFGEALLTKREPFIIDGIPAQFASLRRLSRRRLIERAGDTRVRVERRAEDGGLGYGRGNTELMRARDALEAMARGDTSLYLSTQRGVHDDDNDDDDDDDDDAEEENAFRALLDTTPVLSPPLAAFDIPRAPLPSLVTAEINLWLGVARPDAPSQTGLHVDFHDNLYILLKGAKRFQLAPPSAHAKLYLHGHVVRVHDNGLLNFDSLTMADGAPLDAAARVRAVELARAAAAAADDAVAERLMDDAMQLLLELEGGNDDDDDGDDEDSSEQQQQQPIKRAKTDEKSADEPPHFSRVDMRLDAAERARRFPLTADVAFRELELRAGQTLYVPAGWFHNVTSLSAAAAASALVDDDFHPDTHMAVSYWFHPPPYETDYWR